ncbi:hypothetical protein NDA17_000990 [Ustilago hordei]|nr:hypothetical protein NDA17_000990 [Ustilago hordei]
MHLDRLEETIEELENFRKLHLDALAILTRSAAAIEKDVGAMRREPSSPIISELQTSVQDNNERQTTSTDGDSPVNARFPHPHAQLEQKLKHIFDQHAAQINSFEDSIIASLSHSSHIPVCSVDDHFTSSDSEASRHTHRRQQIDSMPQRPLDSTNGQGCTQTTTGTSPSACKVLISPALSTADSPKQHCEINASVSRATRSDKSRALELDGKQKRPTNCKRPLSSKDGIASPTDTQHGRLRYEHSLAGREPLANTTNESTLLATRSSTTKASTMQTDDRRGAHHTPSHNKASESERRLKESAATSDFETTAAHILQHVTAPFTGIQIRGRTQFREPSRWVSTGITWFYNMSGSPKLSDDKTSCFRTAKTPFLAVPRSFMRDGMILGREEQDKLKLEFSSKGSNLRACLAVEGRKEKGVDLRAFPPKTLGLHSTKPFERLCAMASTVGNCDFGTLDAKADKPGKTRHPEVIHKAFSAWPFPSPFLTDASGDSHHELGTIGRRKADQ